MTTQPVPMDQEEHAPETWELEEGGLNDEMMQRLAAYAEREEDDDLDLDEDRHDLNQSADADEDNDYDENTFEPESSHDSQLADMIREQLQGLREQQRRHEEAATRVGAGNDVEPSNSHRTASPQQPPAQQPVTRATVETGRQRSSPSPSQPQTATTTRQPEREPIEDILKAPVSPDEVNPLLLGLLSYTVSIDAKHSLILTDFELKAQATRERLIEEVLDDPMFQRTHADKDKSARYVEATQLVDSELDKQRKRLQEELANQKHELVEIRRAEIEHKLRSLGAQRVKAASHTASLAPRVAPSLDQSSRVPFVDSYYADHASSTQAGDEDRSREGDTYVRHDDRRSRSEDHDYLPAPDAPGPDADPLEILGWILEKQRQTGAVEEEESEESSRSADETHTSRQKSHSPPKNVKAGRTRPLSAAQATTPSRSSPARPKSAQSKTPFFPAGQLKGHDAREEINARRTAAQRASNEARARAIRAAQRREELAKLAAARAETERLVQESVDNAKRRNYYDSFVPLLDVERARQKQSISGTDLGLEHGQATELLQGTSNSRPASFDEIVEKTKQDLLAKITTFDDNSDDSTLLPEHSNALLRENYRRYFDADEDVFSKIRTRTTGSADLDLSADELSDYKELLRIAGETERAKADPELVSSATRLLAKKRHHEGETKPQQKTEKEKAKERNKRLEELAAPKHYDISLRASHGSRMTSSRSSPNLSTVIGGRRRPAWRSNLKQTALPGGVFGRPPSFGAQLDRQNRRTKELLRESTARAANRGDVVLYGLGSGRRREGDDPKVVPAPGTTRAATDPSFGCTGEVHTIALSSKGRPDWESRFNSPDVNIRVKIKQMMAGSPALRRGASEFDCRIHCDASSHAARHVRAVLSGGKQSVREPRQEALHNGAGIYADGQGPAARAARASVASQVLHRKEIQRVLSTESEDYDQDNQSSSACGQCQCQCARTKYDLDGRNLTSEELAAAREFGCACGCGPVRQYCPPEKLEGTHPGTYLISKSLLDFIQRKRHERLSTDQARETTVKDPKLVDDYVMSKRDVELLLARYDQQRLQKRNVAEAQPRPTLVEVPFFGGNNFNRDGDGSVENGSGDRSGSADTGRDRAHVNSSKQGIPSTKEFVEKWLAVMDANVLQKTLTTSKAQTSTGGPGKSFASQDTSTSMPYAYNYRYYPE